MVSGAEGRVSLSQPMTDQTIIRKRPSIVTTYTPSLLNSLAREDQRNSLGITPDALPFRGVDVWNAYEFTWLNSRGKPEVGLARFEIPASSTHIPESKSLKLYLGSYAQTRFSHRSEVISTLESDLTLAIRAPASVELLAPEHVQNEGVGTFGGQSLDVHDIEIEDFFWDPGCLEVESDVIVRETLHTHLFRSVCPMTGQPDTASVMIQYNGRSINHAGLLQYLVSYREHAEYSEQIVERIFVDILNRCTPDRLTVQARYNRRGGIDINPYRSHDDGHPQEIRLWRQ